MEYKFHNGVKLDRSTKAFIKQPDGVNYLIQRYHYSTFLAQEYKDMMIEKMETYIYRKKRGERCAPLMTIKQMEEQLENMKRWEIVEV